jgi:hypothetical protein
VVALRVHYFDNAILRQNDILRKEGEQVAQHILKPKLFRTEYSLCKILSKM